MGLIQIHQDTEKYGGRPVVTMFKKLPSTALRKVLISTGLRVCSLQAAPMPIPRPARRFTSRASYARTMI